MKRTKLKLLEIEQLPKAIEMSQISDCKDLEHVFLARTHEMEKERILEVTFFSMKDRIPEFRVFFNKENFISERLYPERKWSESTVNNVGYWGSNTVTVNTQSAKTICGYFTDKGTPLNTIDAFQRQVRSRELKARYDKIGARIDEKMLEIRPLPKDFKKWINDVSLVNSRYIYYKRIGQTINGFCTVCGKDVVLEQAKHNGQGLCPNCKKKITYKAQGKATKIADKIRVTYIQKSEKGIVVRAFDGIKRYFDHYRTPALEYWEDERHFLEGDKVHSYFFGKFLSTQENRWCEGIRSTRYFQYYKDYRSALYTNDLNETLSGSEWQYSQIEAYASRNYIFDVVWYLCKYQKYPVIEHLIKLNLWSLTEEALENSHYGKHINFTAMSLKEMLGLNRDELKFLIDIDGSSDDVELIKKARDRNHLLSKEMAKWIQHYKAYEPLYDIMHFTTIHRIVKYTTIQMSRRKEAQGGVILRLWRDYLDNAKLLGYDMTSTRILFPKNIKKAHDDILNLVKVKENERLVGLVIERAIELMGLYFFQDEHYLIRPPESFEEILQEGKILKHCVGMNYSKSYAEGKTDILFIREIKNKEAPFFTLECKNGKVMQVHGFNHKKPSKEINQFIDTWIRKKKLTYVRASA